jgi:hypothetical protein
MITSLNILVVVPEVEEEIQEEEVEAEAMDSQATNLARIFCAFHGQG